MLPPTHIPRNSGIALGPVLFIIAILAVIAAAIAAASSGFHGNTTQDAAKTQASAVITMAQGIENGVDLLLSHGCSDTQLNFTMHYG